MRCSPRSSSPRCSAGAARAACGGHWDFAARGFPHGGCSGTRRSRPSTRATCWADSAAYRGAGVLEEILFRGLLLGALMPRGPRRAVWLSALAFGLVHALNLLGGAGAGETAAQIVCACAVGVMLALLTLRCGSILPGAAMHGALNVLSALTAPADAGRNLLTAVLVTALAAGYALFLRPRGDKNGIRG